MTIEATERLRARYEEALAPFIESVLLEQGRAIARAVEREGSTEGMLAQADLIASDPDVAAGILALVMEKAAPPWADDTYDRLAPAVKRAPIDWVELVRAWLLSNGANLVVGISEATREMVRAVLERGVAEGLGVRQIARQLRAEWGDLSRMRAERIVRTEVVRASNMGAQVGAETAARLYGLDIEKEWLAALDGRTRDTHAEAHGQRRPLADPFVVGGHIGMYPGDPMLPADETINCRCAVAHVPREEPTLSLRPEVAERRAAVREAYPALRRQFGKGVAMAQLAERHGVGERTIERDVYGR